MTLILYVQASKSDVQVLSSQYNVTLTSNTIKIVKYEHDIVQLDALHPLRLHTLDIRFRILSANKVTLSDSE